MKMDLGNNCVILSDDKGSYADFVPFLQQQLVKNYQGKNVVVDLLKYTHITLDELLELLVLSNTHRAAKHSFVIVNSSVDPDDVPEELVVVPTLKEAEDIIEMEEIERDLGF